MLEAFTCCLMRGAVSRTHQFRFELTIFFRAAAYSLSAWPGSFKLRRVQRAIIGRERFYEHVDNVHELQKCFGSHFLAFSA